MREFFFTITDPGIFKRKALQWASQFDTCCYLDSNDNDVYGKPEYDLLIAAGAKEILECKPGNAFEQLKAFHKKNKEWLFGFFSYDLKNEVEHLHSSNPDHINFPSLLFFSPQVRVEMKGNRVFIYPEEKAEEIFAAIEAQRHGEPVELCSVAIRQAQGDPLVLNARFSKNDYLSTVSKLREHIAQGDIYEVNLCQEFYADGATIDPLAVFQSLNKKANAPFSSFLKHNGHYLISSSPERFMQKKDERLISQPIKGTIKRGKDSQEDEQLKNQLQNDPKERAENIMIVDLVRNDLSRVCEAGSVKVEELCGVYTFQQVHHLVSTVSGKLRAGTHFIEAIKNAFPMGSMTGAPKVRAMELIEQYERTRRGLYSGALGYITPDGDFDLNVVIRSILYNENEHYLSYQVGGAITYESIPEKEYEECLLKAEGMREVLMDWK